MEKKVKKEAVLLEKFLWTYYELDYPLFRETPVRSLHNYAAENPWVEEETFYWFTQKGERAYHQFCNSVYALRDLAEAVAGKDCNPVNTEKFNRLLAAFDRLETSGPYEEG